jgi:hypothetical protein
MRRYLSDAMADQIVSIDATQRAFEVKDDNGVKVKNPWPIVEK